nr:hypothetical protein HAGR004_40560 [Bdellovibrio sp. HAGR004]
MPAIPAAFSVAPTTALPGPELRLMYATAAGPMPLIRVTTSSRTNFPNSFGITLSIKGRALSKPYHIAGQHEDMIRRPKKSLTGIPILRTHANKNIIGAKADKKIVTKICSISTAQ